MSSNEIIWITLASSAGFFVIFAIIFLIVIWIKIKKKRKEIISNQISIENEIMNKESEIKMRNRADFGEPISELQAQLGNTINHEIVEFCINSAIRNEYRKILLIGNVEPYESIAISNKSEVEVFVKKNDFQIKKYNEIKNSKLLIEHNLTILEKIDEGFIFDSIMCLNSMDKFDELFLKNKKYLKENGMFIIANIKANKKSLKQLIKEVEYLNYRYDIINWYTGFITIVKAKN